MIPEFVMLSTALVATVWNAHTLRKDHDWLQGADGDGVTGQTGTGGSC